MSSAESAEAVRQLLKYVLQDFEAKGGKVVVPVGCNGLEDWLLDNVEVSKLMPLLKKGAGHEINVLQICSTKSTKTKTPKAKAQSKAYNPFDDSEVPTPVSVDELMTRKPGKGADNPFVDETADDAATVNENEPKLDLPQLQTGMEEHQLKELAYTIFFGACGKRSNAEHVQVMRAQLEMSEGRALEVQRILATALRRDQATGSSLSPRSSLGTLETQVKLLQFVRPQDFDNFRHFVRWRDTTANILLQILQRAAQEPASEDDKYTFEGTTAFKRSLARLRGGLRRLNVRDPDEYDEQEYTEAATAVFQSAQVIATQSRTGWAYPWAVRIRLCDLMLRGMFDTLDEASYVESKDALLQLLQNRVWPLLGVSKHIHNTIYAWIHFRQFAVTGDLQLLDTTKDLIHGALSSPHAGRGLANGEALDQQADDDFSSEVSAAIVDWIAKRMSDYHKNFHDTQLMQGLLEVMASAEQVGGPSAEVSTLLAVCIRDSLESAFQWHIEQTAKDADSDAVRICLLAKATVNLLGIEVTTFSPALTPYLPIAADVAAKALHELFGSQLLPWLATVENLTDDNLEAVRQADHLEGQLMDEMEDRETDVSPWGILNRLSPLLFAWVSNQLIMLNDWSGRIQGTEEWKPVTQQRGCARSAVDIVKIASETIEGLFNMRLALPVALVRALTEGLDEVLRKYVKFVTSTVGSIDALVPATPNLTRYKRELAVKAEEAAVTGRNSPKSSKGREAAASDEQQLRTPDDGRIAALTTLTLVTRINSLLYIEENLPAMEKIVQDRWEEDTEGVHVDLRQKSLDWLSECFEAAHQSARQAIDYMCNFIGMKTVFFDLRRPVLEELYQHHVEGARLHPVLVQLDAALEDMVTAASESLPPYLARSLLQAITMALQRILLDGGPYRLYIPDDIEYIEQDLEQLKGLFLADGQGLPAEDVDSLCAPVVDLLNVLQLETGILIKNFKDAKEEEKRAAKAGRSPTQPTSLVYDPDILQRVLAHRADRNASKFLKKELRLPKKLSTGTNMSSSTFSSGGLKGRSGGFGRFRRKA
ncbi:hypothetical protein ABBQ32_010293 [Trebouxia sp. C0010 RCD-2024]